MFIYILSVQGQDIVNTCILFIVMNTIYKGYLLCLVKYIRRKDILMS